MEIKILGTVSPTCHDTKNCPGYLITKGNKKILLDCGNGCTRYLNTKDDLSDIIIIISHLHHDHWGDLLSLGYDSYILHNLGILKERVKVYIPEPEFKKQLIFGVEPLTYIPLWLNTIVPNIEYEFLTNLGDEHFLEFITYDEQTKLQVGEMTVDFSPNPHQVKAYSTRVKDEQTTIVYSGDTGYQNNTLTELAKDADLLLCESTFLIDQPKKLDYHLTTEEAAHIAKTANVSNLLLTHFYPTIDKSKYVEEAKTIFENTEAAEEGKVYKLGGRKWKN